jgi:aminoglycoside 3-N-acetyltransferase
MPDELTTREIERQLRDELKLDGQIDIIAHINAPGLGPVKGGPEAILAAVLSAAGTVVMPAFTYQTQVIPQTGPPNNAIDYGKGGDQNSRADIYRPDLPVHPDFGLVAEMMRQDNDTLRSTHPILSFTAQGPHAREILSAQTRENPLGPIGYVEARDGAVLMMGLDQRHNVALHLAEQRAGREGFTRWALTLDDIEELHHIPGDREGFNTIWGDLMDWAEVTQIGMARVEVIKIRPMLAYAEEQIRRDPNFMLCDKPTCAYCRAREVKPNWD